MSTHYFWLVPNNFSVLGNLSTHYQLLFTGQIFISGHFNGWLTMFIIYFLIISCVLQEKPWSTRSLGPLEASIHQLMLPSSSYLTWWDLRVCWVFRHVKMNINVQLSNHLHQQPKCHTISQNDPTKELNWLILQGLS